MIRIIFGVVLFAIAQVLAWFQSNSGILGEPFKSNYVWIALVFGPIVSLLFSTATIYLYEHMQLWSIRFITFGIGYLVFIPLTWYFLGEEVFTLKNIISFLLCLTLISIQFLIKQEENMDYTYLWLAFAVVFIGIPCVGSWAIHQDWR